MATMQEVINTARLDLNDDSRTRITDPNLLIYANNAIQEAIKARPDLFIGHFNCLPEPDLAVTDDFPLPSSHIRDVADYIIARAHLINTEDSAIQRSGAYLTLAKQGGGL